MLEAIVPVERIKFHVKYVVLDSRENLGFLAWHASVAAVRTGCEFFCFLSIIGCTSYVTICY